MLLHSCFAALAVSTAFAARTRELVQLSDSNSTVQYTFKTRIYLQSYLRLLACFTCLTVGSSLAVLCGDIPSISSLGRFRNCISLVKCNFASFRNKYMISKLGI